MFNMDKSERITVSILLFFLLYGVLTYIFSIGDIMAHFSAAAILSYIPYLWYVKLLLSGVATLPVIFAGSNLNDISSKKVGNDQHGSARFAGKEEKLKIYREVQPGYERIPGFVVERANKRAYWKIDDSDNNLLLLSPPGGGKTKSVFIPTILYNGMVNRRTKGQGPSMLLTDCKDELLSSCGKALEEDGYLYLLFKQKNGTIDFTYGQLAEALELSAKTVFNGVRELTDKGYISAEHKKCQGRTVAMLFRIVPQPCHKWVWVEAKLFELHLKPSELKVYLYIKCRANHMGRAWPSISRIGKETGLAKETVRRAILRLSEASLLCRKGHKRICNCFGNNEYVTFSCVDRELIMISLRKKKARTRKIRRKLKEIKKHSSYSLAYIRSGKDSIDLLPLIRC